MKESIPLEVTARGWRTHELHLLVLAVIISHLFKCVCVCVCVSSIDMYNNDVGQKSAINL
jgi:hypothetical protein